MQETLEEKTQDVGFRDLFRGKDFIPFVGVGTFLLYREDIPLPTPKTLWKETVYDISVTAFHLSCFVGGVLVYSALNP